MTTKADKDFDRDLTAADIFNFDDTAPVPLVVPGWKGRLYIKPMTAERALIFGKDMRDPAKRDEGMVRGIIESVCDNGGTLLFTHEDIAKLQQKAVGPLNLIQKTMLRLNGLSDDATQQAQETEAKND